MSKQLQGQLALVTGGSRGIGAAIARKLAEEGAHVVITYTSSPDKAQAVAKELQSLGVKAAALQADQGNVTAAQQLVETVIARFGRLNILVINAGIFVGGAVDDPNVDLTAFERQLAVNVSGVATLTRAAVRHMKQGSRIIVIGSINGEQVQATHVADYSATKAALNGYVRGWARDLGPKNITVNLIQPGPINTDMNPETTDFAKWATARIALGRYGTPEEVANAVAFIASPEASFITGTALNVDGGFNA